nr:hypothetical protein [Tanacetum cinerariifolium]
GVASCLTEFCLKEVNSVKVGSKCRYLGSSPHTMTDVTAPTGQAPTMAPLVRSNDQSLSRVRWVQTGYLKFSAKGIPTVATAGQIGRQFTTPCSLFKLIIVDSKKTYNTDSATLMYAVMIQDRSTCSSPDMDNGEVAVAGMRIQKADAQDDIPNANHNVVNQVICGSANDP